MSIVTDEVTLRLELGFSTELGMDDPETRVDTVGCVAGYSGLSGFFSLLLLLLSARMFLFLCFESGDEDDEDDFGEETEDVVSCEEESRDVPAREVPVDKCGISS